jgi:hypothetical protein
MFLTTISYNATWQIPALRASCMPSVTLDTYYSILLQTLYLFIYSIKIFSLHSEVYSSSLFDKSNSIWANQKCAASSTYEHLNFT